MASRPCTCGASSDQSKKKFLKRIFSSKKSNEKKKKNPYSDRGIDKFAALLAEVEEKKRMIYSQLDPQDVSMIRFVQTGDNNLNPVVVTTNNKAFKFKSKELDTDEMKAEDQENKPVLEDQVVQIKKQEIDEICVEEKEVMKSPSLRIQTWLYVFGGIVVSVLVLLQLQPAIRALGFEIV